MAGLGAWPRSGRFLFFLVAVQLCQILQRQVGSSLPPVRFGQGIARSSLSRSDMAGDQIRLRHRKKKVCTTDATATPPPPCSPLTLSHLPAAGLQGAGRRDRGGAGRRGIHGRGGGIRGRGARRKRVLPPATGHQSRGGGGRIRVARYFWNFFFNNKSGLFDYKDGLN